jgi:type IV secretory pathway VirB10-like protein
MTEQTDNRSEDATEIAASSGPPSQILGKEIPPLGGAAARPVNKMLIGFMALVFLLFSGGIIYFFKVIQNKAGSSKPQKEPEVEVAAPPERKRVAPLAAPDQKAIPLASESKGTAKVSTTPPPPQPAGPQTDASGKPLPSITDKRVASVATASPGGNDDPRMSADKDLILKRSGGLAANATGAGAARTGAGGLGGTPSAASSKNEDNPCDLGPNVAPEERRRRVAVYGCDDTRPVSDNLQAEFVGSQAKTISTNMSFLLPRGTNVPCVLDQRLISDFTGQVSCTITNDIFSMNAQNRLLPRGSRLLGTFTAGNLQAGSERIAVAWDRIRTPYGVDIEISSPATDSMGGAGVPGRYEGYYWQKISTGLWLSAISDLFKYVEIKHAPTLTTTTITPGGPVITEQPFDSATVKTTAKIADQVMNRLLQRPGSVIVEQGQLVNTIITKDISFEALAEVLKRGG